MNDHDYAAQDGLGLASLIASRQVSPREVLDAALRRMEAVQPRLNCIASLALDEAEAALATGLPQGPFTGVPFLLKDLGAEAVGFPSTLGSRFWQGFEDGYDSEVFLRLKALGIVTFGRTTSPELGIGPVTESQVYGGPTRNPHDPTRTSGGSSGGAAAAVAARILPMAHASDGGGSTRVPAACCGLVGLKATRARLPDGPGSGEGWAGMAVDGFLTRSIRDSAALLDGTHGPDLGAPYHPPAFSGSFLAAIETPPPRLRIAFTTRTLHGRPVAAENRQAVETACRLLADLGHELEEAQPAIDLEGLMLAWNRIIACGTALSVQARARDLGRQPEPQELEGVTWGAIALAESTPGTAYLAAVQQVHALGRQMARFMTGYDVFLSPTLAEPPALVGRFKPDNRDFLDYRSGPQGAFQYSPFTVVFNASGQPAINLPLIWTEDGLPIGLHFAGRFGDEALLLRLGRQLEQAMPWSHHLPKV